MNINIHKNRFFALTIPVRILAGVVTAQAQSICEACSFNALAGLALKPFAAHRVHICAGQPEN
jgi:hypothetical protein